MDALKIARTNDDSQRLEGLVKKLSGKLIVSPSCKTVEWNTHINTDVDRTVRTTIRQPELAHFLKAPSPDTTENQMSRKNTQNQEHRSEEHTSELQSLRHLVC